MIDPFGRNITYLRVSVTDRCDLRCVYCMPAAMKFLPKTDVLSLEELDRLCSAFIGLGVRKLRVTGGEPLVRRGVLGLFRSLGRHIGAGDLDELTMTTNGTQLARHAPALFEAGVRRVNVSLDTLDADRFRAITRTGDLDTVLRGIFAAQSAGLGIKINMVALRGTNDDEFDRMIRWCGDRGFDLTFIETMPLGAVEVSRSNQYLPLSNVRADLQARWTFEKSEHRSGGPARYVNVRETGGRIGFITPLTHNFCESCNRIRLTCTGRLYLCLGQDHHADLREVLRAHQENTFLVGAIEDAIQRKPRGHEFLIERRQPTLARHMNLTGG